MDRGEEPSKARQQTSIQEMAKAWREVSRRMRKEISYGRVFSIRGHREIFIKK